MKIKTFRFIGSKTNYSGGKHFKEFACSCDIDDEINIFLNKNVNELIDIKINTIDTHYHNNGGYNTIDLLYTIIYK